MEPYFLCAPQEGGGTFRQQLGHGRRETGEYEADGQSVSNEVLDGCGELSDFVSIGVKDLVHCDRQAKPVPVQQL